MHTMLNGRLMILGVDVEDLSRKVLSGYCRRTQTHLNQGDIEDAMAYLVASCWELSEFRYDPDLGVPFATHAFGILSFRVTDWLRKDEGRSRWQFATHTYERPRPDVISLDGPAHPSGDDSDARTLGDTLAGSEGRDAASDPAARGRLYRERDRDRARRRDNVGDWLRGEAPQ